MKDVAVEFAHELRLCHIEGVAKALGRTLKDALSAEPSCDVTDEFHWIDCDLQSDDAPWGYGFMEMRAGSNVWTVTITGTANGLFSFQTDHNFVKDVDPAKGFGPHLSALLAEAKILLFDPSKDAPRRAGRF